MSVNSCNLRFQAETSTIEFQSRFCAGFYTAEFQDSEMKKINLPVSETTG